MSGSGRMIRGLIVAGTHSGVGKTTVALGLMAAFRKRGLAVQPFKVGPDFIDPGHHTRVAGRSSRNLDGWMLDREMNLSIFVNHSRRVDVAVVEGVMGLFDGFDGLSEAGSTAQVAKWLDLPVLLVVDARSMARSAGAVVKGFAEFDPEISLSWVVFNRIGSEIHLEYLRQALTGVNEVQCIGGIPRDEEIVIPERYLGLVTGEEHPLGEDDIQRLTTVTETHLDLDHLLAQLPERALAPEPDMEEQPATVRLGVARDRAFCFYYPENLEWLRRFGAELVLFSPLEDGEVPRDLHGLYLGGGYPEVFAAQLAANTTMKRSLCREADRGMPIYAECGGLMYLCQEIQDLEGRRHAMTGILPLTVRMLPRLRALGYREITLMEDGLLGPAGTKARGHEFHYSEIASETVRLKTLYRLSDRHGQTQRVEGYCRGNVLASYVHLHFGSNPQVARQLVQRCQSFKEGR